MEKFGVVFVFLCFFGCMTEDMSRVMEIQDDHEARIRFLEDWCGRVNEEIEILRLVMDADAGKNYITDVSETAEGLKISFAQGGTVTVRNGAKGDKGEQGDKGQDGADGQDGNNGTNAPVIGVGKFSDGVYYWMITVGGVTDWLKQDNKMLRVTGNQGAAGDKGEQGDNGETGFVPQLGVNNLGYWTVNGVVVRDAYGLPVSAVGEKGEQGETGDKGPSGGDGSEENTYFKNIENKPDVVVFTLKDPEGETFTLAKSGKVGFAFDSQEMIRLPYGSSRTVVYTAVGVKTFRLMVPEGWQATIDTLRKEITLQSPAVYNEMVVEDGVLSVSALNERGQSCVVSRNICIKRKAYYIELSECTSSVTDLFLCKDETGSLVAEVCLEYVKGYSEKTQKRTLVIYPYLKKSLDYASGHIIADNGQIDHDGNNYISGEGGSVLTRIAVDIAGNFVPYENGLTKLTSEEDKVTDVDGNVYGIVKLGQHYWMKENLKSVTLWNENGTKPLPPLYGISGRPVYVAYKPGSERLYGWLYDYRNAVLNAEDDGFHLIPEGWHVPTNKEWTELKKWITRTRDLRAISSEWIYNATFAPTDLSGFGALPGGYINSNNAGGDIYADFLKTGHWWSSSVQMGVNNIHMAISYNSDDYVYYSQNNYGKLRSIRCIRDNWKK